MYLTVCAHFNMYPLLECVCDYVHNVYYTCIANTLYTMCDYTM